MPVDIEDIYGDITVVTALNDRVEVEVNDSGDACFGNYSYPAAIALAAAITAAAEQIPVSER